MTFHISAVRIFAISVMAVSLGLLALLFHQREFAVALSPAFWLFVGLIALAELRPVISRHRSITVQWTLSTPFMVAMLLYKGSAMAALVCAVASVIADLYSRRAWDRIVFNAGQYVCALTAAGLVLRALGYTSGTFVTEPFRPMMLVILLPAVTAFMAVNHVLVRTAVALDQRDKLLPSIRAGLSMLLANGGLALAAAPVIAVLAGQNLLLVSLLVIPVTAAYRSAQMAVDKEHQAGHDALTGLPNRMLFQEELTWMLGRVTGARGPAVILLDLNRFKEVNEALGHKFGDELLRNLSARLREFLPADVILARLGGDEFGVLLPAVDGADAAMEAAAGLTGMLRKPVVIDDLSLDVSASMGLAVFPEHGRDVDTLVRCAEVAMYVAKERHGGIEVYRAETDQGSRRRLSLIHDLRKAVDRGDLTVAYQPQADFRTGEIVGMEALVRWNHPELGPVSPAEFIPLAERTGLIAPITAQVLEKAMADCALWHRSRFELSVAVNFSPQVIYDRSLQRTVQNLIDKWALEPCWLELEITESTIMGDPEQAARVLNSVADQGMKLAIDDFGTGYSSLALLKQLPVHKLKIDRSFISDIEHDTSDTAIVGTTVQLARSLGMTVCAEGVETQGAWNRLVELECDLAQGFFISRPLPGPEIMAWLVTRIPGPDRWSPTAMLDEAETRASVVDLTIRQQTP